MSGSPVPSGQGYVEVALSVAERKPLKSIQVHQSGETLNVDLEFEDDSMMEMVFRVSFQGSIQMLGYKDGNYHLRKRIKLKRSSLPEE